MRILFGVLGIVVALFPDRIREAYEDAAFENPGASEPKPWLDSGIRTEGVLYTLASLAGGRSYAWLVNVAGVAGVLAALFPKQYLETGGELAYEDADVLDWREDFVSAVRGIGVALVLLALVEKRRRTSNTAETSEADETSELNETDESDGSNESNESNESTEEQPADPDETDD